MKPPHLVVLCLLSVVLGCGEDPDQTPTPSKSMTFIAGVWHGTVQQEGWDPYPVKLTLVGFHEGQTCGSISYPSYGCNGTVTCLLADESRFKLLETIDSGSCKNGGTIWIQQSGDNNLEWDWSWQADSITATAKLSRN